MTNKIKELINNSVCFGVAYDCNAVECRGCDVHIACEKRLLALKNNQPMESIDDIVVEVAKPEVEEKSSTEEQVKVDKPSKKPTATKKSTSKQTAQSATTSDNLPKFSQMSLEELNTFFVEHGGDLQAYEDKYSSLAIRRMRMVMWLKANL